MEIFDNENLVEEIWNFLEFSNININSLNHKGFTSLSSCIKNGRIEMFEILLNLNELNINQENYGYRTALSIATEDINGTYFIHRLLDQTNIKVNLREGVNGATTPLFNLMREHDYNLCEKIFQYENLNVNQKSLIRFTPLMVACKSKIQAFEKVRLLLTRSDIDSINLVPNFSFGNTHTTINVSYYYDFPQEIHDLLKEWEKRNLTEN